MFCTVLGDNQIDALEGARGRLISYHLYLRANATVEIQHGVRGPSLRRTLVEEVTLAALNHARSVGPDVKEYKALAGKAVPPAGGRGTPIGWESRTPWPHAR